MGSAGSYWLETLGCPKNQVDSEKLAGTLREAGYGRACSADQAELIVVNTCAFIEAAREESVDTILELSDARRPGARLVVTGCMAQRYGAELAKAMPEVDLVAGFGVPVALSPRRRNCGVAVGLPYRAGGGSILEAGCDEEHPRVAANSIAIPSFDLLELERPPAGSPWAYVKVAEGCDRSCGFCAIPSFRGRQRSRRPESILKEVEGLGVAEVVLVAQDLASYGRDLGMADALVPLVETIASMVSRVRLLYLYPSSLSEELVNTILGTGVAYFDLSLQHVSRTLLRRMRRWGSMDRFVEQVAWIRAQEPGAVLRSSFILGYPGETEEDHDQLLEFLDAAQLDWGGFFAFSEEEGTYAQGLDGKVPSELAMERLRECSELQDRITTKRREDLLGDVVEILVDAPGEGRSYREAPEIDGVIHIPQSVPTGSMVDVRIVSASGPDLVGELVQGDLVCQLAHRRRYLEESDPLARADPVVGGVPGLAGL